MYNTYVSNCDEAQQLIIEWRKSNETFDALMRSIEVNIFILSTISDYIYYFIFVTEKINL